MLKMNSLSTKFFLVSLLIGLSTSLMADCQDLIVRMRDPDTSKQGGREITTFFNCHNGSYEYPGGTTIHLYEWKQGRLCQTVRSCGNIRGWRGTFSAGAVFSWGKVITDFTNNTRFANDFIRLADGHAPAPGGNGGPGGNSNINNITNNANFCIDKSHGDTQVIGNFDYSNTDLECSPRSTFNDIDLNLFNFNKSIDGHGEGHNGIKPNTKFICAVDLRRSFTGINFDNSKIYKSCKNSITNNNLSVGGNGGDGGDAASGHAPVFGNSGGTSTSNGRYDTSTRDNTFYLDFSTSYENIHRYCGRPQAEICY